MPDKTQGGNPPGKKMRVLVTAGDTYESVDEVRRITHMATGRLGSLIADAFAREGAEVTYLCGERSLRPTQKVARQVEITGVMELMGAMEALLEEAPYDCLVHSMAVSDYTVQGVATEADLAAELEKALVEAAPGTPVRDTVQTALTRARHVASGKLSSDLETLTIFMRRAPKVISVVKKKQPHILLVGFKLLAGAPEEELLAAARLQMEKSGSDFVLANDLSTIEGDGHIGMLVGRQGILARPGTKPEIAASIVRAVAARLGGEG